MFVRFTERPWLESCCVILWYAKWLPYHNIHSDWAYCSNVFILIRMYITPTYDFGMWYFLRQFRWQKLGLKIYILWYLNNFNNFMALPVFAILRLNLKLLRCLRKSYVSRDTIAFFIFLCMFYYCISHPSYYRLLIIVILKHACLHVVHLPPY